MIHDALELLPVERLGWVLVHFLWEGALVALVLAVLLHVLEGRSAAERYGAGLLALASLAVLPVVTWFVLPAAAESDALALASAGGLAASPGAVLPEAVAPAWATGPDVAPAAVLAEVADLLAPALPWIVAVWALGVLALSLHAAGGWALAQQLRRQGTEPVGAAHAKVFERLARRLGVTRPARLLRSTRAAGPMTIGWWRPVVLVPGSVLTGLPPEQVEAILAHELAHIRRYDYLVGLVQSAIETLLFYHPAVWWVSD